MIKRRKKRPNRIKKNNLNTDKTFIIEVKHSNGRLISRMKVGKFTIDQHRIIREVNFLSHPTIFEPTKEGSFKIEGTLFFK